MFPILECVIAPFLRLFISYNTMLLEHEINQLKEIGILQIWSRTPHGAPPQRIM